MDQISSNDDLLNDTLKLINLARETAKASGKTEQFDRFTPVIDNLMKVAASAQNPSNSNTTSEIMAQSDFHKLISISDSTSTQVPSTENTSSSERNQIALALSAGGMQDVDIARQLGMARDDVRTLLQIYNKKNM